MNNMIDIFQSIYGHSIRKNKGNTEAMATAVKASLLHYCSTEEKPHDGCPKGPQSWCTCQRDVATGGTQNNKIPNSSSHTKNNYSHF